MTKREKMLSAAVAAVVVLWAATQGIGRYRAALELNRDQQLAAEQNLLAARNELLQGRLAERQLDHWLQQSLPTNPDVAKSLYQDWLHKSLSDSRIEVQDIKGNQSLRAQNRSFQQLSFTVDAKGSLTNLTRFLAKFYQAPHLHRISRATVTPTDDPNRLTILLTVDALTLAENPRIDELASGESEADSGELSDAAQAVNQRNLFAAYQARRQVGETGDDASDPVAAQAFVSRTAYGAGGWQMSVKMGDSGRISVYEEGDRIRIGRIRGTVDSISDRSVIVSTDDAQLKIYLGDSFAEAQPVDPAGS